MIMSCSDTDVVEAVIFNCLQSTVFITFKRNVKLTTKIIFKIIIDWKIRLNPDTKDFIYYFFKYISQFHVTTLSSTNVIFSALRDLHCLLQSSSSALEYTSPFVSVTGVGCIFISPDDSKTFSEAKTSCPTGSALATPSGEIVHSLLVDHVNNSGEGSVANSKEHGS